MFADIVQQHVGTFIMKAGYLLLNQMCILQIFCPCRTMLTKHVLWVLPLKNLPGKTKDKVLAVMVENFKGVTQCLDSHLDFMVALSQRYHEGFDNVALYTWANALCGETCDKT